MSKTLFEPGSPTFNELIGNGKVFDVPRYQRDYAWEEEDWDDLWNDILGIPSEQIHYMGYVVLQRTADARRHWIIDGQQRVTTLSILVLAVVGQLEAWIAQNIDREANERRVAILKKSYLEVETAATLTPVSKLNLNRNNDAFYKDFVLLRRKPIGLTKHKPSERRLWGAFDFFAKKIKEQFGGDKNGEALATFLETTVGDKLVFSSITVGDDLNAYKVFETLNARGVKLSTGDLLKNYLLSLIAQNKSEHDIQAAERSWQRLNDTLQKEDLPTFVRHFWNSRYPLKTKTTLFKAIKDKVLSSALALKFLRELEDMSEVYAALNNPNIGLWSPEEKAEVEELNLIGATQCYTVILAAFFQVRPSRPDDFLKVLKHLVVLNFRYTTICQLNTNDIERTLNKTAMGITDGRLSKARDIFKSYDDVLYVEDERFHSSFVARSMDPGRNKKLVRYLLCKLEGYLGDRPCDWNNPEMTIEHILPENAADEWSEFATEAEHEEYVSRLGNLTLLEPKKNRELGRASFSEKKAVYQESGYVMTQKVSECQEWTPNTIIRRQKDLANAAKTVWRVSYA